MSSGSLQDLRRAIYVRAKADPSWRFWGLWVHICKQETLTAAYQLAKRNNGAPGSAGVTFAAIEEGGVDVFLEQLRTELVSRSYRPQRVRHVAIPKGGGKLRRLSIPTIRDRVVQGAVKLILEPIFEADFQPGSYGYRPKRKAHAAVDRVATAIAWHKTRVVDLDLRAFFDTVRHDVLLRKVARRVRDRDVLHVLWQMLKATGKQGVPQGGVITPRTQKVTFSLSGWSPAGVRGRCLIYVVNSNMYMSHDSCDQGRESAAAQRSLPAAAAAEGTGRGGAAARPGVCSVAPASLPLPPGSGGAERAGARGRANRRDHLQTPGEHRPRASRVRPAQRAFLGADRDPGADGVSGSLPPPTWVSRRPGVARGRCSSTMRSIGFAPASSLKPTSCSSQPTRARSTPAEGSMRMQMAAIYARVSSDQQREAHTIASQTAALVEWAKTLELAVPEAWIVEDEGYSGATLERPGLERVRDLAATGDIQVVLVHSPDRLSRKYAYQVLLLEEFAREGVETRFLNAPASATAEDQLLVQFQGMIAEYERAQILERSRRGKRHRARAGEISVLSGAPYGYRYIRKREEAPASYAVIEAEARVVRDVYEHYTVRSWSIGAITRWLNDQGVATRKAGARWERSTVWAMLRNPAYRGTACFGKTRAARRQRVTRPLRMRGGSASRDSAHHERPREEWIEIPVPALIDEPTFARAQELLEENKVRARRRTIEPSLVQGLVSCRKCGYALSRTSTRSSARKIHYYRCIGSDGWRHLAGPRCDNRPVRQDLLDQVVWTEVMRLLEDPTLIQQELDRRLAAAQAADPMKTRTQAVERDLVRVGKTIERLLTAYQEDLVSLEQLRERMPLLRQREHTLRTEMDALVKQTRDRAAQLRLAETLSAFLARVRVAADTLDIQERQRIVRLVVKEVLVGDDTIVIRHCIPVSSEPPPGGSGRPTGAADEVDEDRSYLLRTGSTLALAQQPLPQ